MDPGLIGRAQSGDVDAFTALVAGRIEPMQRTAMAILGHEADARDAAAESLAENPGVGGAAATRIEAA